MNYYTSLLTKIFTTISASPLYVNFIKFLLSFWLFFAGIKIYFAYIFCLILIDVATGIPAALKRKEKFTSRILKRGLLQKTALYFILMLTFFFVEKIVMSAIIYSNHYLVMVITLLISFYESVSIMENVLVLNPQLGFLKRLIGIAKKAETKTLDDLEDKIEKGE